jgi:membrane protein DedA with SNARE-associated domain
MLEILALMYLTKKNGAIAEGKGHKPGRYKLLTVLFWLGGEVLGGIVGGIVSSGDEGIGLVYVLAILGAIAGATLSRVMVKSLPNLIVPVQTQVFD